MRVSPLRRLLILLARGTGRLARLVARGLSSPILLGLLLALYGLASHYVAAIRHYAPLRIAGWLDVKAQLDNVFHAALLNAWELPGNLVRGRWVEAMENLTNFSGIRTDAYTRVFYAGATNDAEAFVIVTPWLMAALIGLRLGLVLCRRRRDDALRGWRENADRTLVYFAHLGLASAVFSLLLLNSVQYYQNLSSLTGVLGYLGSALATAIDMVAVAGSAVIKEVLWHAVLMLTDGKEKTLGLLTHSRELESLSHYLARFPTSKIVPALHTATYQALGSALLLASAHFLQRRAHRSLAVESSASLAAKPRPRPRRRSVRPAASGYRRRSTVKR